jgi:hypothetical protein
MKTIVAITGCAVSGIICCLAAWKICEAGISSWPWFLLTGILILFVSGGLAHVKHDENEEPEL